MSKRPDSGQRKLQVVCAHGTKELARLSPADPGVKPVLRLGAPVVVQQCRTRIPVCVDVDLGPATAAKAHKMLKAMRIRISAAWRLGFLEAIRFPNP